MNPKIVADSCCDLSDGLKEKMQIDLVPLTIEVGGHTLVDDETLDTSELIQLMKDSEKAPVTACPSPAQYMEKFEKGDPIFVVTLSSVLSGSYNSAMLAKRMFQEQVENKFIHVFDSLSACVGETIIALKLHELIEQNLDPNMIVKKVNHYIKEMKTFFVLESLDNLVKAGRLSKLKGKIASSLNINPIMGDDGYGDIKEVERVRGNKKVFRRLVEIIGEQVREQEDSFEEKILGIAHTNALEKAKELKNEILKNYNFRDVIIVETAGISTVYAYDGGIVVAF